MKARLLRKWWLSIGITAGLLALVWAVSIALAQEPRPEAGVQPQGGASTAATVNSRINYQGLLMEGGVPVTGNRSMWFDIYGNETCSGMALESIYKPNVPVADGLFSVYLDVGPQVFSGGGRWLQIVIDETTSIGCEEIRPVPYALSLRPGAAIIGSVASPSAVLQVTQSDTNAFGIYGYSPRVGVYGEAVETGVWGHSYGHIGYRAGVYGDSVVGAGVRGVSTYNHGVYGQSTGLSGHGGHFVNTQTSSASNQVGVWAGTYWGNIFEGHEVNEAGNSTNRRFRVSWEGYVYADGSYNCGLSSGCFNTGIGADLAERIDVSEALAPGDVVEIDPQNPGQFRLSRTAYSTLVVGVVSTNPAITMNNNDLTDNDTGERTDTRPLLALVGIVPVKVSAENGPILPGDLLVASSVPGHAMRAGPNPPAGSVIGKALEPLAEGTGVIRMLVMLQ